MTEESWYHEFICLGTSSTTSNVQLIVSCELVRSCLFQLTMGTEPSFRLYLYACHSLSLYNAVERAKVQSRRVMWS